MRSRSRVRGKQLVSGDVTSTQLLGSLGSPPCSQAGKGARPPGRAQQHGQSNSASTRVEGCTPAAGAGAASRAVRRLILSWLPSGASQAWTTSARTSSSKSCAP
jgi:hypothetical protein